MPTVVCPAHGLRYDPEVSAGCIRCPRSVAATPSSPGVSRRGLLVGTTCLAATAAGAGALYQYREQLAPSFFSDDVSDIVFAEGQTGSLFEPPTVLPTVAAPLILLFDPNGLAHYIVNRYSAGARRLGWSVASPTGVKNGTRYSDDNARMNELLAFVRARRVVDSTRIFTGGFSGGACLAYRFVLLYPDLFAGAVVESGHMEPWREAGSRASSASRFFLHTRDGDFNRPATGDLERVMREKGCRVTKLERPGGHDPMDSADVEGALAWLTS